MLFVCAALSALAARPPRGGGGARARARRHCTMCVCPIYVKYVCGCVYGAFSAQRRRIRRVCVLRGTLVLDRSVFTLDTSQERMRKDYISTGYSSRAVRQEGLSRLSERLRSLDLHRKDYIQATRHAVRQEGLSIHSIRAAPFPRGLSLFSPWETVHRKDGSHTTAPPGGARPPPSCHTRLGSGPCR